MSNKTTKKDFQLFKSECEKWIDYLGLKHWSINIYHENRPEKGRASCYCEYTNKVSSIVLNIDWSSDDVTDLEIKETAFHEVLEVFLFRLRGMSEGGKNSFDVVDSEIHSIIRTLENTLYKDVKI